MNFPDFIAKLPALDLPFSEDVVQSRAIRSDAGLTVFFTFFQDVEIPAHAHLAQWGTVIEGSIELTMLGETKTYRPGDHYAIEAGVEHAARIAAGTKAIDVFEEADRYPIKS
ncbi:hypothetical protein NBRC116601_32310 [Cognatishimia sp. WU-CL00825]|uniref:cupin domain-containing protein n=1 Tax=Cognatishimia sp. WU-CL00825 TaxID=3127658 RepID=UPI00310BAB29